MIDFKTAMFGTSSDFFPVNEKKEALHAIINGFPCVYSTKDGIKYAAGVCEVSTHHNFVSNRSVLFTDTCH
jgi:hypothetical protein